MLALIALFTTLVTPTSSQKGFIAFLVIILAIIEAVALLKCQHAR